MADYHEDEERKHSVAGGPYMWDDSELEWKSWVVPIFVAANIVIFIVTMYTNNCPSHHNVGGRGGDCVLKLLGRFSFEPLRRNPLLGPAPQVLLKMGALEWETAVHQHQGWRLITSIWLHTGLVHLLVNMLSLLFVGIRLEQQFGSVRIVVIYLLAGLGGNIVTCLFIPNHISVGASGALLGLIAAMFSELFTNWTIYTNKLTAVFTLLFILIINTVVAIVPYHGYHFGHILGGFLAGFLLGFVLLQRPHIGWITRQSLTSNAKSKYKPYQYVLGVTSLVLLIIGYITGMVMLFRGGASPNDTAGGAT